jgi:class 3 adenylate cyclase/tetratricopeptide (TPR) repeat protein
MRCPRRGHENPASLKFCGECGARLASVCLACGVSNAPTQKFCGECGALLSSGAPATKFATPDAYTPKHLAEKILTSKAALEGERKQVTVLFADLKGSMELLADRDPEEARKILDPVLEHMMEAVHRYEGTVNQVMGDGIMALFGAPLAHEDHAVRACYAALRMQESVKSYSEAVRRSHGIEVQIRAGLNSGEVVVRAIGSDLHMDYTAVGQTTHLAARMEQLATPGSIRLTADTLRLAEGYVEIKPLGPVPVKGLSAPIEVYEFTGTGAVRSRLQAAAARGLTRFVGRDTEMEQLRKALAQSQAGHGQLVATAGDPGVGKSRLFHEFTHSHRTQDWLILESGSVSYGKATSYLRVIDLLKGYFKVHDRETHREIREKVTGKLLTPDRTFEPTLPALLALLDVPVEDTQWQALDPPQRRRRILDAVKGLLLRESQLQPLLVIFEDLHWIDSETQALLDSLVESLPTARLLLLVNYRPEYRHGWGSKTFYSQLRLDALPPESANEVLLALLGTDATVEPLKPVLIARTGGNPLFLEESVRALAETYALTGVRGAHRLARPLATIAVPATVQAILASRIDRLAPEDKQLLQTASVIGKDVPCALLQAVAELPEDALHRGLAHLQRAEFLYETSLFPDLEYTFKHALTHEVAYGSLLQERRRAHHASIMHAMEQVYAERVAEHIERLAYHAVRGEVWEKALHYGRQVGMRRAEGRAYRESMTGYEQALDALNHLPATPDNRSSAVELRCTLGVFLTDHGEYQKSLTLLGEAEALARELDDRAELGRVLSLMSYARRQLGDLDGAIAVGEQALEVTATLDDSYQQTYEHAYAAYRLGQAALAIGEVGRAVDLFRGSVEAVSHWRASDAVSGRHPSTPRFLRSASRAWLTRALSVLGGFTEGRRVGEEALRLSMEDGGRGEAPSIAYGSLGILYVAQGDLDAAIEALESGLALCRAAVEKGAWSDTIAGYLSEAYGLAGHFPESLALFEEMFGTSLHTDASTRQNLTQLSVVYRLAGRFGEAGQHASQALDLARKQKARGLEASALFQLGAVHAHASHPDVLQAEMRYQEALALAEPRGMRLLIAHCHLGLGKLHRRTGKGEEAREHLITAATMYREMDMPFWLKQAETAHESSG